MNVLLLLMSLVAITTEMCIMRLCPLGKFYSTTSGSCVSSCYPGYGNWTTGNCTEVPIDQEVWLDATVYEIFIKPTTTLNEVIAKFNLTVRENYLYEIDSIGSHDIDDIMVHPKSSDYFSLTKQNSSNSDFHGHDVIEVQLLSTKAGTISLNDYKMTLEVTIDDNPLTSSDIIIHVVDPLPTLPVPDSCVGFSHSTYYTMESDGLLNITLQLTGDPKSFPVNLTLIANVSDVLFSNTDGRNTSQGHFNITFLPNTTQLSVNVSLQKDKIAEECMVYLYIPSSTYELGVQGSILQAVMVGQGTVFFSSSEYNLDDNVGSGDGSVSIELLLSRPFEETTTIYISVMDEDRDELDTITVEFNTSETSYIIEPELLRNASIPANISAIVLAVRPFEHPLLSAGDKSETRVILINEVLVEWISRSFEAYENSGYVVATLTSSAAYSFQYNITIISYGLDNTSVVPPYSPARSKTDFQSEPFNITVMKYSTTIMCHIPIFPDMALAYRKIFGLKFSISDEVSVKVGSTSESRAIIINTDRVYVKFNKPHYFVGEMAQAMLEVTVDRSANVSFTVNFTTNTSDLIVPPGVGNFQPNNLNTSGTIEIPEVANNSVIQLYLEVPHQFQMMGVLLGELSVTTVTIIDDSYTLIGFASTSYFVTEISSIINIIVKRKFNNAIVSSFSVALLPLTADANSDYVPFMERKTFPANTAEMVISVRIVNDLIVERNETFKVVLQDPGRNVVIGEHNETTITIINDDFISIRLSSPAHFIEESSGSLSVKVALTKASLIPFEVNLIISNDTATAEDFNYTSVIPVKFEAGIIEVTVNITIVDDAEVEDFTERFTIELVIPNSAKDIGVKAGSITKAMVTIVDDDTATVEFTQSQFSAFENESPLVATLEVSAPVGISFQVFVIATPLTGQGGAEISDFMVGLIIVDFAARQSKANVSINIMDDDDLEPAEEFRLTFIVLAMVSSIKPGNITEATGRILNDDRVYVGWLSNMATVFEGNDLSVALVLNREPGITFTVSVNATNLNTTRDDYNISSTSVNFAMDEINKSIIISPRVDGLLEFNETFQLQFEIEPDTKKVGVISNSSSVATITIQNIDIVVVKFAQPKYNVTEGSVVSITVIIGKSTNRNFSFILTTLTNSSSEDDFVSSTFELVLGLNETETSVLIHTKQDKILEPDETFFALLQLTEESYNIGARLEEETSITAVTIINTNVIYVGLTTTEYFSFEDSRVMAITLESDPPTNADISVSLKLTPKSASEIDFVSSEIEVVFSPNSTLVSVNITIFDDIYPEFNESFDIAIMIPAAMKEIGVKDGNITKAIGFILNDDSLYVSFNESSVTVDEGNSTMIQIVLDHAAGSNFSVNIVVTSSSMMITGDDYSLPQTVKFGPNETIQNIILEAVDDDVVEYDEVLTLKIDITDELMEIGIILGVLNEMTATIVETDVVTVSFESNYTSVVEGGKLELTVVANYAFVLTYDILILSNYDEGANNYYTATFKAGETLTKVDIDIKEDSVVETVKQYSFMLNGSNQSVPLQLGTPDHLQVDVIDNDVMGIGFDQESQNITEGDVGTVSVVADNISEENVTIYIQVTPITASVDDYYYYNLTTVNTLTSTQGNTSIINNTMGVELVLVSGQNTASISITTVDDDIVESTESLHITIYHVLTTGVISLQITGQNSSSIQIVNNDETYSSLAAAEQTVVEGHVVMIVVEVSRPLSFDTTVNILITPSNSSETASVDDYSPTKLTTTITPGSTNTTVMFVITDDDMLESEEIFEILLIVPKDMAILLGNITTLTLTVIDNDETSLSFSSHEYIIYENDTQVTIILTSNNITSTIFEVELHISKISATAGDFNTASIIPITFEPNIIEVVVNITIVDDMELELTEEFSIELVIPDIVHNIGVNPGSVTSAVVKIVDDDTVIVEFTQSVFTVFENELEIIITLEAHHPALTEFTVIVVASPDTADASDFEIGNTTVTFGPADTRVMFPITITNDNALELTEEFRLTLFIPDISRRLGVMKGARNFAAGRIMNDDGANVSWSMDTALVTEGVNMSISLMLNRAPGVPFAVFVNSTNINTTDHDYAIIPSLVKFDSNDIRKEVIIMASTDKLLELNETFALHFEIDSDAQRRGIIQSNPSIATITILNNDIVSVKLDQLQYSVMEGSNVSVKILADKPVLTVYSVLLETVSSKSSSRASADDFIMEIVELLFTPNQTEISFSIHTLSDFLLEADEEFVVRIEVTDSSKMIGIKHSEPNASSATVTIINTNEVFVELTANEYFTVEDSGIMFVSLESNQPANTSITVILQLMSESASGMDFKNDDIAMIFGPNDSLVESNITIVADIYPEFNETFSIRILIPLFMEEIGVKSGNITKATGVIWNDDSLYVSFEDLIYNVIEGTGVVIQVILDHLPGSNIDIMIDVNPLSATALDYILSRTNVIFGPNDTSQNVTLLAVDDDIVEYDELLTMSIMIPDQLMDIGVLPGGVTMTTINITDNDRVTASLSPSTVNVNEGDNYTIAVTLDRPAGVIIGLIIETNPLSATAEDFDNGTIVVYFESTEVSQNLTLATIQDLIFEPKERFELLLKIHDEYQHLEIHTANDKVMVNIANDDELTISFTEPVYSVFENQSRLKVQLECSQPPYRNIAFTVTPVAVNASKRDVILKDVDGRFKFNQTKTEVEIRIKDDSRLESTEIFRLMIVIAKRYRNIGVAKGTLSDALVKIISDDTATVQFSANMFNASENNDLPPITVNVSRLTRTPFSIYVIATADTAIGDDYHLTTTLLLVNFSGDSVTADVNIPIVDDQILEHPEMFSLQISIPQESADIGILLGDQDTANVTIIDNDGVIASFSSSSPNVKEGDNYTVTVSLDKPPGRLIGFIIETIPLSATSSDFEIGPFEVNFESNDMSRNLTLEIFQDLIFEPVESFELHLTVPDQYQHLKISIDASNDNVRVRINSDDELAISFAQPFYTVFENESTLRVQLECSQPPYRDISVTVRPTAINVTRRDLDLSDVNTKFMLNETKSEIDIRIKDDSDLESVEVFQLRVIIPKAMRRINVVKGELFSALAGIISDDTVTVQFTTSTFNVSESNDHKPVTLAVSRSTGILFYVVVKAASQTATGDDYQVVDTLLVNFSGDSLTTDVNIPIVDDQILERPEMFSLQISISQESADIGILLGDHYTANVTIIDNDEFSIHFDDDVYIIGEHQLVLPITVIAERPALVEYDVLVHPVITDSNATGGDLNTSVLTAHFGPNDTNSTVHIIITNDAVVEPREAFRILLSLPVDSIELGVLIGDPANAVVVILDDDNLHVFFRHLKYTTVENSTILSVEIEASKPAGITFSVSVVPQLFINKTESSATDKDINMFQMPLALFGPTDNHAVVNVTIIDDDAVEDEELFQLQLMISSSLQEIGIMKGTPNVAEALIVDNDVLGIRFETASQNITEGDKVTITLVADHIAEVDVYFVLQVAPITASVKDYGNSTLETVLAAGQQTAPINISTLDDKIVEKTESFNLMIEDILTLPKVSVHIMEPSSSLVRIANNDETHVSLSATQYTILEGFDLNITVEMDFPLGFTEVIYIVVGPSNISNTATDDDYTYNTGQPIQIILTAGVTTNTVTLAITDDDLLESTETLSVSLGLPLPHLTNRGVLPGNVTKAIVNIVDNDETTLSLSSSAYTVNETSGIVLISVTSSNMTSTTFIVELHTIQHSATAADFNTTSVIPITFEPNITEVVVNITIVDDMELELTEEFSIELVIPDSAHNIGVNPGSITSAVVKIVDDDTVNVEFTQSVFSAFENESEMTITLEVSHPALTEFTVIVVPSPDIADGSDFTTENATVTFEPDDVQGNFSIRIIDDDSLELVEEFNLELIIPFASKAIGVQNTNSIATGRILSDDRVEIAWFTDAILLSEGDNVSVSLILDRPPGVMFIVSIIVTDIDTTGADYIILPISVTFDIDQTEQEVYISALPDSLLEFNETFELQIEISHNDTQLGIIPSIPSTLTVTIYNNDSVSVQLSAINYTIVEGSNILIIVLADKPARRDFSVLLTPFSISTTGAASADEFDNRTLVLQFGPNQTVGSVMIQANHDLILENDEVFYVRLELTEESEIIGVNVDEPNVATVTIINTNVVFVRLTSSEYFTAEDSGVMTVSLECDQPANISFTVNLQLTPQSASDIDFKRDDIDVVFGPNDTQVFVNIIIFDDSYPEFNETFNISVIIPSAMRQIGVMEGDIITTTGFILNDDSLYINFEQSLLVVSEGHKLVVQIMTDHPAGTSFSVTILASVVNAVASDYNLSHTNVTFGPNDTSQNVTLLAVDDDIVEYDELLTMSIMIPDQLMDIGVLLGDVNMTTVNITDNDRVIASLSPSTIRIVEGDNFTVTINLDRHAGTETGLMISLVSLSATADDYENGPFMVQFNSNETVKTINVVIIQDALFEQNEIFEVTLQVQDEYQQLGIDIDSKMSTIRVTINNDDELKINFLEQLYTVFENESVLRVQLECSQPPYRGIPVTLKLNPINVTRGDLELRDVSARFMINQTVTAATITIRNDNNLEAIELFELDISISRTIRNIGVNKGPLSTALVRIVSDDTASVQFSTMMFNVSESNDHEPITLTVNRLTRVQFSIIVNAVTYTATGDDYQLVDTLLVNFSGDSLTANVNIPIVDDQILEHPEMFSLQISIPQESADIGILLGDQDTANVTILDNDEFSIHFDDDVYIIGEHQLLLPITVIAERPALVEYDVLVHPVITDSNATGSDLNTSVLTAHFGPNDTNSTVHIIITNDAVVEPREAFRILLSLPVDSIELGVLIGDPANAVVVILDDDNLYVFFRHLKYTTVENSTIMSVEIEASKPAGISFNVSVVPQLLSNTTNTVVTASSGDIDIYQMPLALFGPTDTSAIVYVTITDDNVSEDQEMFQLVLNISPSLQEIGIAKGTPSVADTLIIDDDVLSIRFDLAFQNVSEGDVVTISLVADHFAEFQLSFIMQITPVTASSEDYYHSDTVEITLLPGQQVGQMDIVTVDDEVVEFNKSLTVRIGHIIVSQGIVVQIERPNSSFIEIIDNDETHVNLLVDHYSVVEGDDLMITIELSNQLDFNGIVYIITSPSNSSKSASSDDYSPILMKAFLFPGITNTTVTLAINDDDQLESDELFDVSLFVPFNMSSLGILPGNATTASLNIVDNDELTISLNSQEYSVTEGNFVVIMINANKPSGTPYEAHLTIPGAEVTANRYNQSHLIVIHFGPSDLTQQFELQVHNNTVVDPPVEFEVSLSVSTNISQLGVKLGANQSATVVVIDSGIIEVSFTQNEYTIPNPPMSNSCVIQNDSLPLPSLIMLQLDKPASANITVTIVVKQQEEVIAYFGPGETLWIMNNSALLELRTNELQFEIKIPENSIEIVVSFPNQARAVIATLEPGLDLLDYKPTEVTLRGDGVMLMCYARGRSKISYHWEHHRNGSDEWRALETESGLLMLPSVTDDDEGEYHCVACDCYSCSYSKNTTTLVVYDKPTVGLPSSIVKLEYTSFNVTCTANVDPDSPRNFVSIEWRNSSGNLIANNNGTNITSAVLNFMNTSRNASGEYECSIFDGMFSHSDVTNLHIQYGPTITNITSSHTLVLGQPLVLRCEAHGDPLPLVGWYHNGTQLNSSHNYNKSRITTGDSGVYTCVTSNTAAGIPMSNNRTSTINVLSSLPSPRQFHHILLDYDVTFTWEDPNLPSDVRLANFILFYNVTDAFQTQLNETVQINAMDNSYIFNSACSYETGLSLCPSSEYCFVLKGTYIRNEVAVLTIPTNRICFTTDKYPLIVSFADTHYNTTEGTSLNIKLVSSRTFSTDFYVYINVSLISALASDFNVPQQVLFNTINGQETILIVDIIDDIKYEPGNSSFSITISIDDNAKPLGVILGDNKTATIFITDNDKFRACEEGIDGQWSIRWNKTKPRNYDEQKCPGELSLGVSSRLCDYGGVWHQPNVSTCVTREFINIKNKTDSLNTTDTRNITDIVTELVNITKPNNQSQLPQDISVAVEVLETIINRLNTTNERPTTNNGDVVDSAISVINNLLNETNKDGWNLQSQNAEHPAEMLLETADELGRIISFTLIQNVSSVNATETPSIEKENIVIQTVQITKEEISQLESSGYISFLSNTNYRSFQGRNVSVNYPSNTVKEQLKDGENITFVNMVFSNLGDFLTAGNTRVQAVSDIISTQINWNYLNDFDREPIELLFEVPEIVDYEDYNISCVFWNFSIDPSKTVSLTRWSKEGIKTIVEANSSTVKCLSSHLSSFAVVAENLTIITEINNNTTTTPTVAATTSEPPTSQMPLPSCCSEDVQQYRDFNVTWNITKVGETVVTDCKADGVIGNVTRTCGPDTQWLPAKIYCIREQISMVFSQITNLTESFSNLTVTEQINETDSIIETLVTITQPDKQSQYPQELSAVVGIISTINNFTEEIIENRQPNDTFFQETLQVFDNLLSENNEAGWRELQEISSDANQELVRNAEQFGQLLARTLGEETQEVLIPRSNIVVKAEITTAEKINQLVTERRPLRFPNDDDIAKIGEFFKGLRSQISLPNTLLSEALNKTNGTNLPLINTVFRNLASVLPNVSWNDGSAHPISAVLSSQISDSGTFTTSNPVELEFDITENNNNESVMLDQFCGFWDFNLNTSSDSDRRGGWSREGVELVEELSNNMSAICRSYHLTSFAVLVSIHEPEKETEAQALTVVSYIGCSISIVCLIISIVVLGAFMYKNYLKGTHVFIHFNLCIALLLGNIVFVSGVDTATSNRGACIFVAVMLQYFFTSAFCWMLCEGVILYLMLVIVFSSRFNNRLFFFALGWGPAIPIVAISVGIAHDQYGIDYCWISTENGAIAAFIVPMVVIILINCVFLGFALRALYHSKKGNPTSVEIKNANLAKYIIKATVVLLPVLGLTWLIGIISVNESTTAFAWIFTILNSLQGVFVLFFHVLRNQEVKRRLINMKLRITSSTFRSTKSGSKFYPTTSTHSSNTAKRRKSSQSDTFSYNQPTTPTTPVHSGVFSEGYLSTTLDRPSKKKIQSDELQAVESSLYDPITKEEGTNASKPIEMNITIGQDIVKDFDTISEAGTIKDSDTCDEKDDVLSVVNDNTDVDKSPTEVNVLQIVESAV